MSESAGDSIDSMNPVTAEDFEKFKDVLSTRLCKFEVSCRIDCHQFHLIAVEKSDWSKVM